MIAKCGYYLKPDLRSFFPDTASYQEFLRRFVKRKKEEQMKVCQNQFKVGSRYIYSFDNSAGHTEALVEIVRKTNRCAIIKFIEIYEEHTGNGIFAYLLKIGGTMGASYELLKEAK